MRRDELLAALRVEPGQHPRLDQRDPGARLGAAGKQAGSASFQLTWSG